MNKKLRKPRLLLEKNLIFVRSNFRENQISRFWQKLAKFEKINSLKVVEISDCNDRYQRKVNDERQAIRVELKIFRRFVFKQVFRVSRRSVP